ncbi:alternative ribosome rescue aminoacyl-tRNA hydrolase ArfB [Algibacter sp. R77976]|uniref:alternative ribosome rescue aminoacyl-tRNA hydrolase ArfB n=1 Tax=Algibacter sp. R77976 TaxID=3093873 RepID=UPI0037C8F324
MFDEEAIQNEISFKAIRSSGSGGQHVNKVSSKVELTFNVLESLSFNEEQRHRLVVKLKNRLTKDGVLILQCGESRSQHKNKQLVIKRFLELIKEGLKVPKKRKPTKVPKSVIKKRLKSKRKHSEKKVNRQKPNLD